MEAWGANAEGGCPEELWGPRPWQRLGGGGWHWGGVAGGITGGVSLQGCHWEYHGMSLVW